MRKWLWFSTQYRAWWAYYKVRAWRFWKSLWYIFSIYAVLVFLSTALLTFWAIIHDKAISPEKLAELSGVTNIIFGWLALGGGAIVYLFIFIVFTILSSFPKGRDMADNTFKFAKPTKSEQFEISVEKRLSALEKFKAEIEKRLNTHNIRKLSNAGIKPKKRVRKRK